MSSLMPVNASSLRVATTSPITRASCTSSSCSVLDLDFVDDADNGRINRTVFQPGGHPRRAAADHENRFADAGVDRVDGDEVSPFSLAAGIHGADDEHLAADEAWIFAGRNDGADDLPEDHGSSRESIACGIGALDFG